MAQYDLLTKWEMFTVWIAMMTMKTATATKTTHIKAIMTMSFIVTNLDQINTWDIIMNEDVPKTNNFFFCWQSKWMRKEANENKLNENSYTYIHIRRLGLHSNRQQWCIRWNDKWIKFNGFYCVCVCLLPSYFQYNHNLLMLRCTFVPSNRFGLGFRFGFLLIASFSSD